MKLVNKIINLLFIILIAACGNKHKIGYINIQLVFNDFVYKKELEKELTAIKNQRKFILDSMETNLKIMVKKIKAEKMNKDLMAEFQVAKEQFMDKKSRFDEDDEMMIKQYDDKIIKQLNAFTKQYGKENKFDIIYGASTTGNIMYADSVFDITKEVTNYMNQKFLGKK
jgi:outer membrane protein